MASRRLFDGATIEIGQVPIVAIAPPPISGTTVYLKVSGVWKVATVYLKVAGVWKLATTFIKDGGVWK